VTVPASGRILVMLSAIVYGSAGTCYMGFAGGGIFASDSYALAWLTAFGTWAGLGSSFVMTGLAPGSQTITAKYRSANPAGECSFQNRHLAVIPLP